MGADIHVYLEKKVTIDNESKWVNIDYWQLNPYYDGVDKYEKEYRHIPVYDDRNYELFNILAGVRGFGDGMIEEPRGIPEDISLPTKKEYERWLSVAHSHSHFTLFELKEFLENNPTIKCDGWVKPEDSGKIDKVEETTNTWVTEELLWVYGKWDEPSPLNRIVNKVNERFKEEFYIYDDNRHIEKEKSIRIVFWFDN